MSRVVAVVVTFQPERSRLARALERLRPQVAAIVVVDNSDDAQAPVLEAPTAEGVELIANGRNLGIGQAQNQGIARARALGATHVLLMDQDSLAPPGLVPSLLHTLAAAGAQPPVALVGPVCRDVKTGATLALIRHDGWRVRRLRPEPRGGAVPVDYLPASGSLIPLGALDRLGPLREDYFIDRVDVEWCLRARRRGWAVLVDCGVELQHDLGRRPVRLLGRTVYVGHDWRAGYHVRNSIAMALRAPIALRWRIDQLLKTPLYLVFYTAVAEGGRLRQARRLLRAVCDGVAGRLGPQPPPT